MGLPRINGEVGRLWKDPTIRYTGSGKAVCEIPLVFSKRRKDETTGKWEDVGSMFVRATAWDAMAENCGNTLSKGDNVVVSGELSVNEYDRKDGSGKGQSIELRVYEIGPSLRWNEAKIQRVERRSESTGPVDDPWGSAPAAGDEECPF